MLTAAVPAARWAPGPLVASDGLIADWSIKTGKLKMYNNRNFISLRLMFSRDFPVASPSPVVLIPQPQLSVHGSSEQSSSSPNSDPGDWAGSGGSWSWTAEGCWLLIAVTNLLRSGVREEAGQGCICGI